MKTNEIIMKAYPDVDKTIRFLSDAKIITIDWNDGNVYTSPCNNDGTNRLFTHKYSNGKDIKTITISTDEMTTFGTKTFFDGVPIELYFGNCPELREINCDRQLIKILEIEKAPKLTSMVSKNIYFNTKGEINAASEENKGSSLDAHIRIRSDWYMQQFFLSHKQTINKKRMFT